MKLRYQLLCLLSCIYTCLSLCRAAPLNGKQSPSAAEVAANDLAQGHVVRHKMSSQDLWRRSGKADLPPLGERKREAVGATDSTDTKEFYEQPWFDGVIVASGLLVIITVIVVISIIIACCCYVRYKRNTRGAIVTIDPNKKEIEFEDSTDWSTNSQERSQYHRVQRSKRPLDDSDEDAAVQFFLNVNYQFYKFDEKLDDLGSRVQKSWYIVKSVKDDDYMILTVAPVSGSCPLQLHKYQRGLNRLLTEVKKHPFIHPIERMDYLVDHRLLVIVQPQRFDGSLKDLIYKVSYPMLDWSQKYGRRSRGLQPAKIARYGRQILEAMTFLYSKRFPMLGHVQSGNIFVVDDVCQLGGYENTLVGYKTRLFMKCRDNLQTFDTVLFGHLIFEMSAGYELTQLKPGAGDYRAAHKTVRPILEYIFEEGFPHNITDIMAQDFFNVLLPELKDFNLASVQLKDNMNTVLAKVHKNKPRVQKMPSRKARLSGESNGIDSSHTSSSWKDRLHIPRQIQQLFGQNNREKFPVGGDRLSPETREPLLEKGAGY